MEATVTYEGNPVGDPVMVVSEIECGKICDSRGDCNSFAFCVESPGYLNCYPQDRVLSGNEPKNRPSNCATFRKI